MSFEFGMSVILSPSIAVGTSVTDNTKHSVLSYLQGCRTQSNGVNGVPMTLHVVLPMYISVRFTFYAQ